MDLKKPPGMVVFISTFLIKTMAPGSATTLSLSSRYTFRRAYAGPCCISYLMSLLLFPCYLF